MIKNCVKIFARLIESSSFIVFSLILIFSLGLLVACQGKSESGENNPTSKVTAVNVCDMFSQQDIEQIFKVSIKNVRNTVQSASENGNSFASQCSYYVNSDGYKSVGIMVRYFANVTNPKTFDELVTQNTPESEAQNEEQKKIIDEVVNSFKTGIQINDIGDSGVWYNWADIPSLMLYFNNHYHLIINLTGFEFNNENMEACKKVAEKLITTLK
jgi:hypothetical protein